MYDPYDSVSDVHKLAQLEKDVSDLQVEYLQLVKFVQCFEMDKEMEFYNNNSNCSNCDSDVVREDNTNNYCDKEKFTIKCFL